MRSKITKRLAGSILAVVFLLGGLGSAFAIEPTYADDAKKKGEPKKYVKVTGSLLPQKVHVKSIGTKTNSPIRVYKRTEIDRLGRFTTEDILAQDPSIVISRGRAGGIP